MPENEAVETTAAGIGLDDAVISPEGTQEPEGSSLDAVLDTQPEPPDKTQTEQPAKQAGWIQKRIQDGVSKQLEIRLAEERQRIAAEYDAKLKPLKEAMLSREADDLVKSGQVTSKEIALEYLRLKNGQPVSEQTQTMKPNRNEKGQFAAAAPNDAEQYGQVLIAQAKAIEAASGLNVMEAYTKDPEVKRMVLSREWDFADVARHMMATNPQGTPLPSPTRRPNGGGIASRSIRQLSSDDFGKINKFLESGGVIDLRQK